MEIKLPSGYIVIEDFTAEKMGMPKNAIGYQMVNEGTNALMFCMDVDEKCAMPFEVREIVENMHQIMKEYEGIVEADAGITNGGNKYAYVIIKHPMTGEQGEFLGTEYTMNINIKMGCEMKFINASFIEAGITGMRESMVFTLLRGSGEVNINMEGWTVDPYDESYEQGFLMNLSERACYDDMFPHHPLSEERQLVRYIIENN